MSRIGNKEKTYVFLQHTAIQHKLTFSCVPKMFLWFAPASSVVVLSTLLSMESSVPIIYTADNDVHKLLPVLKRSVSDEIHSYEIHNHIKQANAQGFDLSAFSIGDADCGSDVHHLFVKKVEADLYAHKPFADLRRTLVYARTEARFYSDILPLLLESSSSCNEDNFNIAPKVYLAESYLEGLIEDNESAAAKPSDSTIPDPIYDENNNAILQNKGGILVLDSVGKGFNGVQYFQDSPLAPSYATKSLRAIAKFHAMGFQNEKVLEKVSTMLCQYGGSYHLRNRNPKELQNIEKSWDNLVQELKKSTYTPKGFFEQPSINQLGKRIFKSAKIISDELTPLPSDKYATIVHGDYKAMNVFLPSLRLEELESNEDLDAILIDFASTGVGVGMSDVAMHIVHAIHPNDLRNGGDKILVKQYFQDFQDTLSRQWKVQDYPFDVAFRHYKFAIVDYFRFVLGRLWRGATIERFAKNKDSKNAVFVNRDVEAALNFIEMADRYLAEIEEETLLNQN